MQGVRAFASLALGLAALALAAAAIVLDLGGPEFAEILGAMLLFGGLFLVAEGGVAAWRASRLPGEGRRDKP